VETPNLLRSVLVSASIRSYLALNIAKFPRFCRTNQSNILQGTAVLLDKFTFFANIGHKKLLSHVISETLGIRFLFFCLLSQR